MIVLTSHSGYSPQLPQLVRLAGMDYFFTQVSYDDEVERCSACLTARRAGWKIDSKLTRDTEA